MIALVLSMSCMAEARDLFLKVRDTQPAQDKTAEKPPVDANYIMQTFTLNYLNAQEIKDTIAGVTAPGEGVMSSARTNTIIVRASQKTIARIEKLLTALDKPPAQVNVEAKILEIKSGNGDSSSPSRLGLSWQVYNTPGGNDYVQFNGIQAPTLEALMPGMYAQLLRGDVNAYLSALEKKIGYDLIASPFISALNHEQAEILIGQKLGYKTLLNTAAGILEQTDYLEVGTKLKFTPHIASDGYIKMEIQPSLSDGVILNGVPNENTTETTNSVLVKDGQTIVIGGLTKEYSNDVEVGVPYLMNIPFLGAFFRRKEMQTEKRDIMVLITPHIVNAEYIKKMTDKVNNMEKEKKKEPGRGKLLY